MRLSQAAALGSGTKWKRGGQVRRGRALDNVFVERLWRSVKYEEIFLNDYDTVAEAVRGLERYFRFYNYERLHQALEYRTPAQVYRVA